MDINPFGPVNVQFRSSSRRIVARWRGSELYLTAPASAQAEVLKFLRNNRDAILALKPSQRFTAGMCVKAPEFQVFILPVSNPAIEYGQIVQVRTEEIPQFNISLGEKYFKAFESADTQGMIEDLLLKVAVYTARKILVPYAWNCARRVGTLPTQFKIHRANSRYGSCSSRRVINLNPKLMFAPVELREYVICHELAHLTHMDHSPAFHALCDRYLGGREKELKQTLNNFKFPF